jgi:hypothetical protein
MSFDVSGTLNAPDTGLPLGSSARTMCAWIAPNRYVGNWQIPVSYGGNGTKQGLYLGVYGTGTVYFSGYGDHVIYNWNFPLNSWIHLCGTYDGAMASLYVNGVNVSNCNLAVAQSTTFCQTSGTTVWNTQAGNLYAGNNTYWASWPYAGKVDGIRLYNGILPARQIRYLATQVPTGLIARYALDSADGTDDEWWDSSGWDQPLTASGGGAAPTTDRFGMAASSYGFLRSSSQFLSAPNSTVHNLGGTMTVMAWIKPTTLPGLGDFFTIVSTQTADDKGFSLELYNVAGNMVLYLWGDGNNDAISVPFSIPVNVYTHVAATMSGGWTRFYVDGNEISSTGTLATTTPSTGLLYIGRRVDGYYMNGGIDEVRMYNRALSLAEIQAMVQQPNKKIFVTVNTYTGNLGGIAGADAKCNNADNYPGVGTYKAIIADGSNRYPCLYGVYGSQCTSNDITKSKDWPMKPFTTYLRAGSLPVFTTNNAGVFLFGSLTNPIGSGETWTGLYIKGTNWEELDNVTQRCNEWTDSAALSSGAWGNATATDGTSMSQNGSNPSTCDQPKNLYCVEQ